MVLYGCFSLANSSLKTSRALSLDMSTRNWSCSGKNAKFFLSRNWVSTGIFPSHRAWIFSDTLTAPPSGGNSQRQQQAEHEFLPFVTAEVQRKEDIKKLHHRGDDARGRGGRRKRKEILINSLTHYVNIISANIFLYHFWQLKFYTHLTWFINVFSRFARLFSRIMKNL